MTFRGYKFDEASEGINLIHKINSHIFRRLTCPTGAMLKPNCKHIKAPNGASMNAVPVICSIHPDAECKTKRVENTPINVNSPSSNGEGGGGCKFPPKHLVVYVLR